MAIQRRVNWISQQRVDVPDMRAIESAASNDMDQLIQAMITGTSQGYFLRGFEIAMAGAIGGAASGLQMLVDPGAVLHISSSQSGTVYMVPAGTLPQQLNSATNNIVDGAFAPSAINYVSLEYERFVDDTTASQVYIWNPTTKNETTKNSPRAQILRYRFKITTATPLSNYLPIAVVTTDSGNNVTSITDARWDLFRLGTGGASPNPFYKYPWTAQTEGRTENPSTSTSNTVNPFRGGDKMLGNFKDWMNAVMTSLQEIKGTTYWYSLSSSGSLESLRQDLGNTVITGKGFIAHGKLPNGTATQAGQLNWDEDIKIKVIGSALTYTLDANPTGADIVLADDEVAYITLIRGLEVTPNLVFTNGSNTVSSVGAVAWTTDLAPGDYIRLGSDTDSGYYEIDTVDSLTQVTLVVNFAGTSTGATGTKAKYAFGSYQTAATPSTNRHIYITTREAAPQGENFFWLFLRTDNAGTTPKVYIKFLGSELDEGETEEISDNKSRETLLYIGAPLESSSEPQYVSALNPGSIEEITSITLPAAAAITSNQYFFINSSGDSRRYFVWFNKNGTGVEPNPSFYNSPIPVVISTGMTATQVATAVHNALEATYYNDFDVTQAGAVLTVANTSAGATTDASNFNVGSLTITTTQQGSGVGNYAIIDGENLTLSIKRLDQAIANLNGSLDDPSYDENVDIVASGATPPTSLTGPVTSGTVLTLPLNTRLGNAVQKYTVGNGVLQIYLNGQYQRVGVDWAEVGTSGSQSSTFQILRGLVVGDALDLRITLGGSGGGGGGIGPAGPTGPAGPPGVDAAGGPVNISTKVANYTVQLSDTVILANCSGGSRLYTLPSALSASGRIFYFKKIDATANAMTIQANGSELIDFANTQSTTTQGESFTIVSDGAQWWII